MLTWTPKHVPEILDALRQHLFLVVTSVSIAFAISMVLGIFGARRPVVYRIILAATGTVFVIPSLALFALLIPMMGLGAGPAIVGLVSYSLLAIVRNVVTGLRSIPPDILDAANGLGFTAVQRLWRIDLPLALPYIVAGLRIASVTVIGIATVAAYINAGGLGTIIFEGIDQRYPEKILVGGLLTSFLAISADMLLSRIERRLRAVQVA